MTRRTLTSYARREWERECQMLGIPGGEDYEPEQTGEPGWTAVPVAHCALSQARRRSSQPIFTPAFVAFLIWLAFTTSLLGAVWGAVHALRPTLDRLGL